jgi:hypothetical protein
MSATVLVMVLSAAAGVLVMLLVPLVWQRVGGAAGFLLGVVLIPVIWGGVMMGGFAVRGESLPQPVAILPLSVFGLFAVAALLAGRIVTRGRK